MHDPDSADFDGIQTHGQIARVLEAILIDTLEQPNTWQRSRVAVQALELAWKIAPDKTDEELEVLKAATRDGRLRRRRSR